MQQALIGDAIESGGYAVSNQQLGILIRNLPQFQVDGKFSDDRYRAGLRSQGQTVNQFEFTMRRNKLLDQIVGSFKNSAIVSAVEEKQISRLRTQTRLTALININPRDFVAAIKISESDIQQYYDQQKARYQEPERLRISYIQLNAKDAMRGYTPNEDDLKALYEEEKGRFTKPGSRRVSHILIELTSNADDVTQKKASLVANEVVEKARGGASFSVLAKRYSNDSVSAQQGGDLGEVTPGLLPSELEEVVYKMHKGDISQPVRTEFGYHIAKLTHLRAPVTKSFKSVRSKLIKLLKNRKSEERFFDMAERFNNLVYEQPDSLQPAADELGLSIKESAWFTRAGGKGIVGNPKVLEAAFSPDVKLERRNSESIELNAESLLALRILAAVPARQKLITEVRKEIITALKNTRAETRSINLGREIVLSARKGLSLASLAKKHGLKYSPAKKLHRNTNGVSEPVIDAVFAAARPSVKNKVVDGVDLGENGFAVFALWRVTDNNSDTISGKERATVRQTIEKRQGTGYYQNYLAGLRKSGNISIYDDKL